VCFVYAPPWAPNSGRGDVTANKAFPSVVRVGLKRVLLDLFIGERRILNPTIDDDFSKVIQGYPQVQDAIL
jgi:hypothetical protein